MSTAQLRIRVEDEEDLQAAEEVAAEQAEVEIEAMSDPRSGGVVGQVEPITAVLIGAGVLAAAKFISDWWEKRRGGLVIDLTPGATDQIRRDRDVPYGVIAIFASEGGKVTVEFDEHEMAEDGTERLLGSVIDGAYKTVTDLAKLAREALPGADVKEEPAA